MLWVPHLLYELVFFILGLVFVADSVEAKPSLWEDLLFAVRTTTGIAVLLVGLVAFSLIGYSFVSGKSVSVVGSESMEPTYHVGDIFMYDTNRMPKIGEVALFVNEDGRMVGHRLIYNDGKVFQTKGDANKHADRRMPVEMLKGTIEPTLIPRVGAPVTIDLPLIPSFTTKLAVIPVAFGVLLFLVSDFLLKRVRVSKNEE